MFLFSFLFEDFTVLQPFSGAVVKNTVFIL